MGGLLDQFVILFVCINCTKALIVYGGIAGRLDAAQRRRVAMISVGVAAAVCLGFVFVGQFALGLFHISLAALKIAGGIILLTVALHLVFGAEGHAPADAEERDGAASVQGAADPTAIAVYPLALPLMATPHGLVVIVTLSAAATDPGGTLALAGCVAAIMAINLCVMLAGDRLLQMVSPQLLRVIAAIVGILLAALAMQLMIAGMRDIGLLPRLPAPA